MENSNTKSKKNIVVIYIALFAVSIAIIVAGAWYYKLETVGAIRLLFCVLFAQILVLFSFSAGACQNMLLGDNVEHPVRFYLLYIFMMILSLLFTAMPVSAWPFCAVFALLVLMSNILTGIVSATVCLIIAVGFGIHDFYAYFILYFLCGLIVAVLLGQLDEQFKIAMPLITIEAVLISGLSIVVITGASAVNFEILLYPIINAAITLILLFLVLKMYSSMVMFVESDSYANVNDPECTLLTELKNKAAEDYMRSIHVAYFCDRIARQLGLNDKQLKCAGYYHRIGIIGGDNTWENTYTVCTESGLPTEVIDILAEFLNDRAKVTMPETAVLYMADSIVSSVLYLYKKNKEMNIDIPKLVETVFKQRTDAGVFKECEISIKQFEDMKKVFVEEKLYYDFLR